MCEGNRNTDLYGKKVSPSVVVHYLKKVQFVMCHNLQCFIGDAYIYVYIVHI